MNSISDQKPGYIRFKQILLIAAGISALLFLKYYRLEHISPFTRDLRIDRDLIAWSASSDDASMILSVNKLYVSDQNNNLKHIVKMNDRKTLIKSLDAYKGRFFISTYEYRKNSSSLAAEKILELDRNGEVVSTMFEIEHPEDVSRLNPVIDSFHASERGIFLKNINDKQIDIVLIPFGDDGGQARSLSFDSIVVDAPVINTLFDRETSRLYVQTFWNDVYCYSFEDDAVRKLPDDQGNAYEDLLKPQSSVTLHVAGMFAAINWAFWISCHVLAVFALCLAIRLLIRLPFKNARIAIIMVIILGVSIYIFSKMLMETQWQSRKDMLTGIGNSVLAEISHRDIVKMAADQDFFAVKDDPVFREDAIYCQELAKMISSNSDNATSMYIMGYFPDAKEDLHVAFESFNMYPFGANIGNVSEEIQKDHYVPGAKSLFYIGEDAKESDIIARSFLHDETGKLLFCVEIGATENIQYFEIVTSVAMKILHLLAIIAFMWALFDCYQSFLEDFKRYVSHKKAGSYGGGSAYDLASIYVFTVNMLIYLDFVLLIFVVNSICDGLSPAELAIKFAIPFTAYGVGGFVGSVSAAPFIRLLGRRRGAIICCVCASLLFGGMAWACIISSLYLLAACKFFEGIFVESVLFTIGEGIPYDIENEEDSKKGIVSVKNAINASVIIGTMVSGLLQQYLGFSVVYMIGAVLSIVLLLLSFIIFNKDMKEDNEEEGNKAILQSWAVYLKPEVMLYLVMIVLTYALVCGFEDFIFPLLVGGANISEMTLADMNILGNTAALIGMETLLPKGKYSPMQLMGLSFTMSGICLLVVFMQPSLLVAFLVLLLLCFFKRPLENYRTLEMTRIASRYGIDEKDIQKNYYAVEDGIRMFQAPVLGPLCNISVAFACGAVGLLCVLFPNIYNKVFKRAS